MGALISILTGVLFACGIFCLLRRSMMKVMIGIILISQAANLLVFTAGGLTQNHPVFVSADSDPSVTTLADPVPQALVLTAIVIGFGIVVFSLALLMRAYRVTGTDDLNAFDGSDQIE